MKMEWMSALRFCGFIFITLFSLSVSAQRGEPVSDKRPYALTISGGISLGVYEAGLNWVIIEQLRDGNLKDDKNVRLQAITGASAGAINTIIAALRYCEKENLPSNAEDNLFNQTWRYIGIEGLLPDNVKEYDKLDGYKDGVFSRKVFADVLSTLTKKSAARDFRNNCKISLGLTVTRHVPEDKVIGVGNSKQNIKVQRFVIPLLMETKNGYVTFKNNLNYPSRNKELGYLFLKQDKHGYISFDKILKSALASSAFPFAFGRVRLPYCRPISFNGNSVQTDDSPQTETFSSLQEMCPKKYESVTYDFVDGGFFDNVPLGLAIELTECRKHRHGNCEKEVASKRDVLTNEIVNYIYMDPSKRRNTQVSLQHDDEPLNDGYGLYNQGKFWVKAQEIHANAELYRTLKDKFDNSNPKINHKRKLLLTDRHPPLAGAYLAHFGAFFGQIFRDYDYYVGIYDGMVNFSNLCISRAKNGNSKKNSRCYYLTENALVDKANPHDQESRKLGGILKVLHTRLFAEPNDKASVMIRMLAEDEFNTFMANGERYAEWSWLEQLPDYKTEQATPAALFVHDLFKVFKQDKKIDFTYLLGELKKLRVIHPDAFDSKNKLASNKKLISMIDEPDIWQFGIGRKILSRLYFLEETDKDKNLDLILPVKLARMVVNSFDQENDNKLWSISSVDSSGFEYLIPDEVAIDGSQTGIVITYRNVLTRFGQSRAYLESEISPLHWLRDRDDRANFASVGLNFRYALRSPVFSSFGFGLRAYKNYSNDKNVDNDVVPGIALDIGMIADKYRVSLEYKDIEEGFTDEQYLLKFGINDFKGFVNLFTSD